MSEKPNDNRLPRSARNDSQPSLPGSNDQSNPPTRNTNSTDCFVPRNDSQSPLRGGMTQPSLRGGTTKQSVNTEHKNSTKQSANTEHATNRLQRYARNEVTKQSAALIPELRFKGFEGDYSLRILKDFTKINQGLQIPISERYSEQVEGSYFYITNEFLRKGSKKSYFIKNPSDSVICFEDDILMTRTGNTGQVVTGVHGAFHNNFFKIKFDDTCEKWYLYFFLTSYITQYKISALAGTSTIPDLNHGDFYKLKITMPKFPEQQKIASFLSAVDEKIQQLSKKKTLLEQYKKGVMQQLFSGELRFKPDMTTETSMRGTKQSLQNEAKFPDWEEKRLGELGSFKGGGTPTKDVVDYWEGTIPWISSSDISDEDVRNIKVSRYINENAIKESATKLIPTGSVLFVSRVGVGKLAVSQSELCTSQDFANFTPSEVKPIFIAYYFIANNNTLHRYAQGTSIKGFTSGDLKSIKVEVPVIKEQQKIASYLSSIDAKIEGVSQQISQTQSFKKGLLQQLFV